MRHSIIIAAVALGASMALPANSQGSSALPVAEVQQTDVAFWPQGLRAVKVSRDGLHVAYVLQTKGEAVVIHDASMDEGFQEVVMKSFSLSQDGNHLAYWAKLAKGYRLIADHVVVLDAETPGPSPPAWSRDGARFGYTLTNGKRVVVMVDGERSHEWDAAEGLTFSADGQHVTYLAQSGKDVRVVHDGNEGPAFEEVMQMSFPSKGGRYAYLARRGKQEFLVVDGTVDSSFSGFNEPGITWSPDGRHVACNPERSKGQWHVRIDGRPGPPYLAIAPARFSADGEHFVFWAVEGDPDRGKRFLVRDGQAGAEVRLLAALSLSNDGSRLAYVEALDEKQTRFVVTVDGRRGPEFEGMAAGPVFSPDGRHVTYVGVRGGRQHLVADGEIVDSAREFFWSRSDPYFGPDGSHHSYALDDGSGQFVVHDGARGPTFDGVIRPAPAVQPDGSAEYLAVKGERLVRVRQLPAASAKPAVKAGDK